MFNVEKISHESIEQYRYGDHSLWLVPLKWQKLPRYQRYTISVRIVELHLHNQDGVNISDTL